MKLADLPRSSMSLLQIHIYVKLLLLLSLVKIWWGTAPFGFHPAIPKNIPGTRTSAKLVTFPLILFPYSINQRTLSSKPQSTCSHVPSWSSQPHHITDQILYSPAPLCTHQMQTHQLNSMLLCPCPNSMFKLDNDHWKINSWSTDRIQCIIADFPSIYARNF